MSYEAHKCGMIEMLELEVGHTSSYSWKTKVSESMKKICSVFNTVKRHSVDDVQIYCDSVTSYWFQNGMVVHCWCWVHCFVSVPCVFWKICWRFGGNISRFRRSKEGRAWRRLMGTAENIVTPFSVIKWTRKPSATDVSKRLNRWLLGKIRFR
jgi:hypothetical protein